MIKKLILLLLYIPIFSFGQQNKIKAYLECRCDENYIKQETSFLEYARDQDLADVEIFVRDVSNPAGSRAFEIKIDGNNEYQELSSSITLNGYSEPHYYISLYKHLPSIENRYYLSRVVVIKNY